MPAYNIYDYEKAYYFQKIKERWKNHEIKWKKIEKDKAERVELKFLGIKIKFRKKKK